MIAVAAVLLLIFLALLVLHRLTVRHKWEYRNPYDRTCKVCGRHEVSHCWAGSWGSSWWEVFREGDLDKHKKGGA